MKREAYRHPKMYDLASRLGATRATAVGLVQLLLDYTADVAPQGDIGKWPNGTISRACDWDGDPDAFVEALVASGWLDRCEAKRLVVHDLADHAEQWWKLKLGKMKLSFVTAEASTERSAVASTEPSTEGTAERSILLSPSLPSPPLLGPSSGADAQNALQKPLRKARQKALPDPSFKPEDVPVPECLDTPGFLEARDRWFAQRRAKRLSLRREYVEMQYRELSPLGAAAAAECVMNSVRKDYQALLIDEFKSKSLRPTADDPRGNMAMRNKLLAEMESDQEPLRICGDE